jgi:UDP-glucose 4-epimerase
MKIAITGGAGFIGSHLARAYLDAGHDVLVIDTLINGTREAVDRRARFYQMDIRDGKLQAVLQRERPDIVSHHAVQRSYDSLPLDEPLLNDADVHIRGLLNVLDGCVGAAVGKIIFASGGNSLYGCVGGGDPGRVILKEDAPLYPQRSLDISKVAGEWYVRYYTQRYRLAHTIFRYADVYGETNSDLAHHPLSHFVRMLSLGRPPTIRGAADEVHDHIFIDDVVSANMRALDLGHNATLHISSGQGFTLKQLYRAAACLLQAGIEPVYISTSLVEASPIILDNTLARQVLRWQPQVDLTTGIRLAIERWHGLPAPELTPGEATEEVSRVDVPVLV